MEKIAIISDIHGNLEALKTTLQDIQKRNISTIYCLGDIIWKGAHSKECLDLIREKCQVVLQGNCDAFFSQDPNTEGLTDLGKRDIKWIQQTLTPEDCTYLRNLPFCYEFYMSGSFIRMFHAGPTQNNEYFLAVDSLKTKKKMFFPSPKTLTQEIADVIIYGHTHSMNLDQIYNKTIINVGSIGNALDFIRDPDFDSAAKETTRACYVILEGNLNDQKSTEEFSIQFIKVPYDIEKELNSEAENQNIEQYQLELRKGIYRDMDKVKRLLKSRHIVESEEE